MATSLPLCCCLILLLVVVARAAVTVSVDFSDKIYVSKTTTTLQVVSNPILDRIFDTPQGPMVNPIHDNAFASLAALNADYVRYVPWFPYPHVAVAELDAPKPGRKTSWNFTYVTPQLEDFMDATHMRNHSTVINFSTQPCWLFNAADCSYPANPDQSDFGYVRGNRLLDPSARDLGLYYGRLLSWLMHGNFTDENGDVHTGGPAYWNMTYWEVFNEAEHGYTQEWYTHDYDVVVSTIRAMADTTHRLKFVGIGGASPGWIPYFLDRSNHAIHDIPLDFVSVHYYASCASRGDPTTYAGGFFGGADGFISSVKNFIIPARDRTSPSTKLDFDELGVIMPDDNNPSFGIDAGLPDIYWNAAGAMYAYLFGNLVLVGVDVLGHSQLAGSPKLPDWGIPLPQYPSVSLLDWRTGYGNARYWVLKLLIDYFAPGDFLFNTTVSGSSQPPSNPFCGEVDGPDYSETVLECADADATINAIQFADWGTPTGSCGSFARSSCSAANTTAYVQSLCLGKHSCTIEPYPALGDPCYQVVKRFVVQASCSTSHGGSARNTSGPLFALGASSPSGQGKKLLLINKSLQEQSVTLDHVGQVGTVAAVDPLSVTKASPNGIRTFAGAASMTLPPFAVWVVELA